MKELNVSFLRSLCLPSSGTAPQNGIILLCAVGILGTKNGRDLSSPPSPIPILTRSQWLIQNQSSQGGQNIYPRLDENHPSLLVLS